MKPQKKPERIRKIAQFLTKGKPEELEKAEKKLISFFE